jgi:protein TonB
MYRADLNRRDKGGAIAAVIAIHLLLLFMLLHMSGKIDLRDPQSALRVFDLRDVPPPPPPPPASVVQHAKPKKKEGGSAPKNILSQATPVVAPKPRIVSPPLQPIIASETPRHGNMATQGASDVVGPGTGAGGTGNGTGSGNGGNGPGGGGGDVAEGPHLVTPVLRGRDIPRETLDQWPRGSTVFMRLRVDARGYVSECTVDRGTGLPAIDLTVCNLAHERLRFRPAVNRSGQPVAGWFGYAQPAPR